MNRFEQLIEYVINDEEQKARELFHDIVVEKSRAIYEDLMSEEAEEDLDEAKDEEGEELDEAKDEEGEELDEAKDEEGEELDEAEEEDLDENMMGEMGGDAQDNLIDDVEAEEQSDMSMEGEDEMGSGEPATKDDIMNLEDKLDELMAEFEQLMGGDDMGGDDMGDGDDFDAGEGGDAIEVDDTEEMDTDAEELDLSEAVALKAAPKPVTSEEGGVNKKSTVAANAGAKGPIGSTVKPVKTGTDGGGKHDTPAYKNTTGELVGKVGNTPAQGTQKPTPATKPHLGQASGVNTKSVIPSKHN